MRLDRIDIIVHYTSAIVVRIRHVADTKTTGSVIDFVAVVEVLRESGDAVSSFAW